ncbi:MAG: hypothetical protein COY66_00770 [Candidatus Kerfeldbacteria bacterium CG_4_10_14_0_8_um_filter_42_10]|uniref:Uncharacterized protein n=1 Tax=Candidatus Kerfeldbacteria bacterium CG_4_10_14_0_8_um_filter_42_10 TaxID=2014248 RepID=A0A2M7RKU9_9BACT|nr:MAG: hypothetical protein COY66_00770 [Candidatus Kerfeldbacteria bacterium CG_4_10_14_0_8_um_filter_42_10]
MTSLELPDQVVPKSETSDAENTLAILMDLETQLIQLRTHLAEFEKHDVPAEIIEGTRTTIKETEALVKKLLKICEKSEN